MFGQFLIIFVIKSVIPKYVIMRYFREDRPKVLLKRFYISKYYTDVNLVIGTCNEKQRLKVHKAILSAGSVFFAELFAAILTKDELDVIVEGVAFVVMEEIVDFLYSRSIFILNIKLAKDFWRAGCLVKILDLMKLANLVALNCTNFWTKAKSLGNEMIIRNSIEFQKLIKKRKGLHFMDKDWFFKFLNSIYDSVPENILTKATFDHKNIDYFNETDIKVIDKKDQRLSTCKTIIKINRFLDNEIFLTSMGISENETIFISKEALIGTFYSQTNTWINSNIRDMDVDRSDLEVWKGNLAYQSSAPSKLRKTIVTITQPNHRIIFRILKVLLKIGDVITNRIYSLTKLNLICGNRGSLKSANHYFMTLFTIWTLTAESLQSLGKSSLKLCFNLFMLSAPITMFLDG